MLFLKNIKKFNKISYTLKTLFYNINEFLISLMSFNKTTSSFFREGFFLDCLQKLSTDKFLKNANVRSIQLFDLNSSKVIRFLVDDVYKSLNSIFFKGDELSVFNVFLTLITGFVLVSQILFTTFIFLYFIF